MARSLPNLRHDAALNYQSYHETPNIEMVYYTKDFRSKWNKYADYLHHKGYGEAPDMEMQDIIDELGMKPVNLVTRKRNESFCLQIKT